MVELVEGEGVHGAGVVGDCFDGLGSPPCSWLSFDRGSRGEVGSQGGRGWFRSRMIGVHGAGVALPLCSDVGREKRLSAGLLLLAWGF